MGENESPACQVPMQDTVESLADYLRKVAEIAEPSVPSLQPFWYRGQANAEWELQPTILRKWFLDRSRAGYELAQDLADAVLADYEMNLNQRFMREAAWLLPTGASLVDIYFIAQHHGFPTRLLDWSTNPLAGLFFAVNSAPTTDAVVFVMCVNRNIASEQKRVRAPKSPLGIRDPLVTATIEKIFRDQENLDRKQPVIPILPDARAGRILQQGSCFTLHPPRCEPINARGYYRIIIPANRKSAILLDLRRAGVNWATLFPDLDHLVHEIRTSCDLYTQ